MGKYFTFYGLDKKTGEVIKLTRDISGARFTNDKRQVQNILLFDEAKKVLLKHSANLYFDKQNYEGNKYGYCTIKPTVVPINPLLVGSSIFVFGYDIDMQKARDLFEKAKIDGTPQDKGYYATMKDNAKEHTMEDSVLFAKCLDLINTKNSKKTMKDFKPKEDLLKTLEDGRVFADVDGSMYCVMVGEDENRKVSTEMVETAGLLGKYGKIEEGHFNLTVSDGVPVPKESKIKYDKNTLNNSQILSIIKSYLELKPKVKELNSKEEKLKQEIIDYVNPAKGKDWEKVINFEGKSLTIKMKWVPERTIADSDKLKADGLYEKFSKAYDPAKFMTIKNLAKM